MDDKHYPPENFRTQELLIFEEFVSGSPPGGRSSNRHLPFTMLADDTGSGLWFGMEWSGAWQHVLQTSALLARGETCSGLWLERTGQDK